MDRPGPREQQLPKRVEKVATKKEDLLNNPRLQKASKHRCNDHLEDVFQDVQDSNKSWADVRHSSSVFFQCLRSEVGEEPPRTRSPDDTFF